MDESAHPDGADTRPRRAILRAGENCAHIEHADRATVIIDGADYFRAVKAALIGAERSIFLIGWDFDPRVEFEPDGATLPGPNRVGKFLNWIAGERPDVQIYLLRWNLAAMQALPRVTTPLFVLNWITHRNVHLRLYSASPAGAAHHQKIIVVDDGLAFVGGIDLTTGRWDRREHASDDRLRRRASGPWHDTAMLIDGKAAQAVAKLARDRITAATSLSLPPFRPVSNWPDGVSPTFTGTEIGIARTFPEPEEGSGIFEIERLYLNALKEARRWIYIESQYLASGKIARAIVSRLREAHGPEIVVLLPKDADGWLQREAMDSARTRLLGFIRANDQFDRFRCYYAVNDAGDPIYVHAKVMVIDDRLLKIGSSNLNNRSMDLDTECDLAIDSIDQADRSATEAAIGGVMVDLVAEHIGVSPRIFAAELATKCSLIATIEALGRDDGTRLVEVPTGDNDRLGEMLADSAFADPERPEPLTRRLARDLGLR